MSGVAVAVMLIALPSAQTGQSQPTRLHLASTPWPPFTNPPGKARFASDLVDEALKRVGITADTTIVDEGALTAALRSGRFDGSAALWKDEARESFLIFSEAYLQNRLVLVGRHGSNVSAASIADLAGKRLAVVQSYSYGDAVRAGSAPRFIQVPTEEESVRRLLAGDVDYALIDELVVAFLVQNYPQEVSTRLAVGSVALVVRPLHFAVRRALPGAQSIIDRFNSVLGAMVADRSYHRLLHIPWIEADIDHDGKAEYVPATDQVSKEAPKGGYRLFSNEGTPESPTPTPRRFYVGGSIYEEWTSVPDAYKVQPAGAPAAFGGSTASVFSFKW
jgi:polar amino acid transport system substrate-binding protein